VGPVPHALLKAALEMAENELQALYVTIHSTATVTMLKTMKKLLHITLDLQHDKKYLAQWEKKKNMKPINV
jgi:hypothetical protein